MHAAVLRSFSSGQRALPLPKRAVSPTENFHHLPQSKKQQNEKHEGNMSMIKIEDIAHVRFAAPDLEAMKAFVHEFGLIEVPSADGVLYARGTGPQPFVHATSLGEPAFQALGLRAESINDLEKLAASEGMAVEESSAPGRGFVVTLADPNGFRVEVVAGQKPASALTLSCEPTRNDARAKARLRATTRLAEGPAHVVRLGHAVLEVKDFRASEAWYKSHFGFITSDVIEIAPGMAIGAFMRCDRGATPTDHHTIFLLQSPNAPTFNHAEFQVADFDDLMLGHTHLKRAKRTPA